MPVAYLMIIVDATVQGLERDTTRNEEQEKGTVETKIGVEMGLGRTEKEKRHILR